MKWDQIARNLVEYFLSNRQVGHTTAMLEGANNTDSLVMGATYAQIKYFKIPLKRGVTLMTVEQDELKGWRKPLVIDHHTQVLIWQGLLEEIDGLRQEINKLKEDANVR